MLVKSGCGWNQKETRRHDFIALSGNVLGICGLFISAFNFYIVNVTFMLSFSNNVTIS